MIKKSSAPNQHHAMKLISDWGLFKFNFAIQCIFDSQYRIRFSHGDGCLDAKQIRNPFNGTVENLGLR